jgi:predicted nucleic acid-binding protein
MNGKILLDTNAIIYALNGALILPPAQYSISIITEMELFSYPKLSDLEHTNIQRLLNPRVEGLKILSLEEYRT